LISIDMRPPMPTSSPVPESGTTTTMSLKSPPRLIVPWCSSVKPPLRPRSVPLTFSIAT
jgi:hypothetical protein